MKYRSFELEFNLSRPNQILISSSELNFSQQNKIPIAEREFDISRQFNFSRPDEMSISSCFKLQFFLSRVTKRRRENLVGTEEKRLLNVGLVWDSNIDRK